MQDLCLHTLGGDIVGISAKHRHLGKKHSRLSDTIDFGKEWYRQPCSTSYWDGVRPVFDELRAFKKKGALFREFPDKAHRFYKPILQAFVDEIEQCADPAALLEYVIGRYDFYLMVKENGVVSVKSYNLRGILRWGKKLSLPRRILKVELKPGSATSAHVIMDLGWSLSFRIHNASSRVEPSLKFDIKTDGIPAALSRHEAPY